MFGVWTYRDAKSLLCVCMLCVLLSDFFTSCLMMISPWYNLRDSRIWWQNLLVLLFVDSWPSTKRFVIWVLSLSYYLQFLFCFLEVWAPFLFTIFVFEISSMVQVRRSIGLVSESVIYQFLVLGNQCKNSRVRSLLLHKDVKPHLSVYDPHNGLSFT